MRSFAALLLFLGGVVLLPAQEIALLETRVTSGVGVPILPVNDIRFHTARYALPGGHVDIYLIEPDSPVDTDRVSPAVADCGSFQLTRLPSRSTATTDSPLVLYGTFPDYRLLIHLSTEELVPQLCAFVTTFVDMFDFFLAAAPLSRREIFPAVMRTSPEFPAVLELPR